MATYIDCSSCGLENVLRENIRNFECLYCNAKNTIDYSILPFGNTIDDIVVL